MSSISNNLYSELKMIAKMNNNKRVRNQRKQTSKLISSHLEINLVHILRDKIVKYKRLFKIFYKYDKIQFIRQILIENLFLLLQILWSF